MKINTKLVEIVFYQWVGGEKTLMTAASARECLPFEVTLRPQRKQPRL